MLRIYRRLINEHAMDDVSYQGVSAYVAKRKPEIRVEAGRGPAQVVVEQSHLAGAEAEVDFGEVAVRFAGRGLRRSGGVPRGPTSTLSECWAACHSAKSGLTT
ncbi:hypothetical protein ACIP2X_09070 [Streptomyces sp. NPDC089424]|uniref:hypothetical protein n=1 Tax=Streptomyces sp. NPDC089424 TaxID=3365917 RepID=UPI0037F93AE1